MHRLAEVWRPGGDGPPGSKTINESGGKTGGEAGIRTLGRSLSPYNGLANRRLQPLGHLTATRNLSIRHASTYSEPVCPHSVPEIVPASSQSPVQKSGERVGGPPTGRQRFFSPTTMPASDWRAPLCSDVLASTSLATRASRTRGARRPRARTAHRQAPVLRTAADRPKTGFWA